MTFSTLSVGTALLLTICDTMFAKVTTPSTNLEINVSLTAQTPIIPE
jgi:hypothetical protein